MKKKVSPAIKEYMELEARYIKLARKEIRPLAKDTLRLTRQSLELVKRAQRVLLKQERIFERWSALMAKPEARRQLPKEAVKAYERMKQEREKFLGIGKELPYA